MFIQTILLLLVSTFAHAHTILRSVNGKTTCLRTPQMSNSPLKDVTSADMECNIGGKTEAAEKCTFKGIFFCHA